MKFMLFSLSFNSLHILNSTLGNWYKECAAVIWKQETIKGPTASPQILLLGLAQPKCNNGRITFGKGNTEITSTAYGTKLQKDHQTLPYACALERAPYCIGVQACILWDHGKGYMHTSKNMHGFLQMHMVDWLYDLSPMPELRSLCTVHVTILCLRWWDFTLISGRTGGLWCFFLLTALCISLTTTSQSKRDVKSCWKHSWFLVHSFSKTFHDATCEGHCVKLIVHLISTLSLFQVCYMHIPFLPVQLFYITLFQPLFSFSTVANSVAGCLHRKVELRQFVQEKKNNFCATICLSRGSHQIQTFSASPCRPQTAKITHDCTIWSRATV